MLAPSHALVAPDPGRARRARSGSGALMSGVCLRERARGSGNPRAIGSAGSCARRSLPVNPIGCVWPREMRRPTPKIHAQRDAAGYKGSLMGDAAGIARMRPVRFSPCGPGRGDCREAAAGLWPGPGDTRAIGRANIGRTVFLTRPGATGLIFCASAASSRLCKPQNGKNLPSASSVSSQQILRNGPYHCVNGIRAPPRPYFRQHPKPLLSLLGRRRHHQMTASVHVRTHATCAAKGQETIHFFSVSSGSVQEQFRDAQYP
jgi:hypothetical protein